MRDLVNQVLILCVVLQVVSAQNCSNGRPTGGWCQGADGSYGINMSDCSCSADLSNATCDQFIQFDFGTGTNNNTLSEVYPFASTSYGTMTPPAWNEELHIVTENVRSVRGNNQWDCANDATGSGNRYLLINGSVQAGEVFRMDNIGLISGNTYEFGFDRQEVCMNYSSPPFPCGYNHTIRVQIVETANPSNIIANVDFGEPTGINGVTGTNDGRCVWDTETATFTAPSGTGSISFILREEGGQANGTDFIVDNIYFKKQSGCPTCLGAGADCRLANNQPGITDSSCNCICDVSGDPGGDCDGDGVPNAYDCEPEDASNANYIGSYCDTGDPLEVNGRTVLDGSGNCICQGTTVICSAAEEPYGDACDYDGDGVQNVTDVDDDNDGILDEDEGKITSTFTPCTSYSSLKKSEYSCSEGSLSSRSLVFNNGQTGTLTANKNFKVYIKGSCEFTPSTGPTGTPIFGSGSFNPGTQGGDITYTFTFINPIASLRITWYDLDNSPATELVTNMTEPPNLISTNAIYNSSTGVYQSNASNVDVWAEYIFEESVYTYSFTIVPHLGGSGYSNIAFLLEVSNCENTCISCKDGVDNDGDGNFDSNDPDCAAFSGLSSCSFHDHDGDGIADQFDTDSDDDGCADALEGSHAFTASDLQANFNLQGGPQAQLGAVQDVQTSGTYIGLPNIAFAALSGGQAGGDFRDDSVQSSSCVDITAKDDDWTATPYQSGDTPLASVLNNDTANGGAASNATVTTPLNLISDSDLTVTFDEDGNFSIPTGTPNGSYDIYYRICLETHPNICSNAKVTIVVDNTTGCSQSIQASRDTYSGLPGDIITNSILDNDIANGVKASSALVDISSSMTITPSTGLTGFSINTDGTFSIPSSAEPGDYVIAYEICLKTSGCTDPCSQAELALTVVNPCELSGTITVKGVDPTTCGGNDGYLEILGLNMGSLTSVNASWTGISPELATGLSQSGSTLIVPTRTAGEYNNLRIVDPNDPSCYVDVTGNH